MTAQHDPPEAELRPPAPQEDACPEPFDIPAFAAALLEAFAAMAVRNRNRQADLLAALHAAGIGLDRARVQAALRLLYTRGCIMDLMPLADGGLLLRVTGARLDEPEDNAWLPPDQLEAGAFTAAKPR